MRHQLLNLEPRDGAHRVVVSGVGIPIAIKAMEEVFKTSLTSRPQLFKVVEKRGHLHILMRIGKQGVRFLYGRAKLSFAQIIVDAANIVLCKR